MIGRTLSHYLMEKRLGAGGMGEVYLARDLALGRSAAVKVLPEGFAPALRARLLREAEACARLQHPGIATFYEGGEVEGTAFIAMDFVRGETLRARLKGGALPVEEAVALAARLLEALSHAHSAGILHRDIKPENIMVTEDRTAKLLDFGLAGYARSEVREEAPTRTILTGTGQVLGTPGYMSPEELRGDPVDARSDLFAVGAVLYEAIAGRPAFPGRTPVERIAVTLSRDADPLVGPGIPQPLAELLSRSLARDPSRRFPSAGEFLRDLRSFEGGVAAAAPAGTLAVLDLRNLSAEPSDDWIGSGIAESLTTDLARAPGLVVLSREQVLKAGGLPSPGEGAADPIELGLRLGCRWVLSGSYQRMGPTLRVTTRLVEVATGTLICAEKIDGPLERIFETQDRLAAASAAGLNLTALTPSTSAPAASSVEAYECYARGRRLWNRLEKGSLDDARALYERAVGLNPFYAPALAGLAAVHAMRFTFTTDPQELEMASSYSRRAIEIDPRLGEPHIWLGYACFRQWRLLDAYREERQAMDLDPSNPFAPYFAACAKLIEGRREEALPLYQQAIEIDRQLGFVWLGLGWTHLELGQMTEARWCLQKAVDLEGVPGSGPTSGAGGYLAECLRRAGDLVEARARCLAALESVERSDHMYRDTFRGVCLCVLGRTAIQQRDHAAAQAAFVQAIAHLRGRPRALGGGQLMVQALAGLSHAGHDPEPFEVAMQLFERRQEFDFSWLWSCTDDITLLELARAASALGRAAEARVQLHRARAAGSTEVV